MAVYLVAGRVVDASTGRRLRDAEVELRQTGDDRPLATASLDDRGLFRFELSSEQLDERFQGRPPNVEIRVSRGGTALPTANGPVGWKPSARPTLLKVPVRIPAEKPSTEEIVVDSYRALLGRQEEILRRIDRTPNGGHLFVLEPFRLLADVGVTVTPAARAEILRIHPGLSGVSSTPYDALKSSRERQRLRYHIRRLDHGERRHE